MGWGCYKHEMDAGSVTWQQELAKLCEERVERTPRDWGRNYAICPLCWREMEERNARLLDALSASEQLMSVHEMSDPVEWGKPYYRAVLDKVRRALHNMPEKRSMNLTARIWNPRPQGDTRTEATRIVEIYDNGVRIDANTFDHPSKAYGYVRGWNAELVEDCGEEVER